MTFKRWSGQQRRVGSQRQVIFSISAQIAVLCLQWVTETDTVYRLMIGQNSCWQHFGTTHILNTTVHWFHRPCSALSWFDMVSKEPSVKADLAIYSHVLGMSAQCWSVAILVSYKLNFTSCVVQDSFCKSNHKAIYTHIHKTVASLDADGGMLVGC